MIRHVAILTLLALTTLSAADRLRADVLVLASGGRIEGELLNPSENPREIYIFRSAIGGQITLDADQVQKAIVLSQAERTYESARGRMRDTVEDHWKLAEWCRQQAMIPQREFHLEHLIRLDPDHADARSALGYSLVEGVWKTHDDRMASIGLTKQGSNWRPSQVIELEQRKRKNDLADLEMRRKIKMWRSWIGKRRQEEAIANLRALRSHRAVLGLTELLEDEQFEQLRQLYIETLGKIGGGRVAGTLIKYAMEDSSQRVRDACLDVLETDGRASAVLSFSKQLDSKDNVRVNRAAQGLARMKDPSAIPALMEALVTRHKFIINAGQPGTAASFNSQGGAGLSQGGGPKMIERDLQNASVLGSLISLTGGANFQYDIPRWKNWYAQKNTPEQVDLRRGE